MTRSELQKRLEATDLTILLAEGFDDAFMGVVTRCGQPSIAIYDRAKCAEILRQQGMTAEDAEEYLDFNVTGAWVGEDTPGFLERLECNS